jgi:hypothetical protein
MREALCDQQQPVPPQADAPVPGLGQRAPVRHLPEELREHAGAVHARADAQSQPPVPAVRQGLLPALAPTGPSQAGGQFYTQLRKTQKSCRIKVWILINMPKVQCKKRLATFQSLAGMTLIKLSLGGNYLIFPAQGEFGM